MYHKKLKTKSVILGRRKREAEDKKGEDFLLRPCFVDLFEVNNPHQTDYAPHKILEFEKVHKIVIEGLNISYLLPGNDIVINDLKEIEVEEKGPHLIIKGKQK